jgi:chromosome segregation ATPase
MVLGCALRSEGGYQPLTDPVKVAKRLLNLAVKQKSNIMDEQDEADKQKARDNEEKATTYHSAAKELADNGRVLKNLKTKLSEQEKALAEAEQRLEQAMQRVERELKYKLAAQKLKEETERSLGEHHSSGGAGSSGGVVDGGAKKSGKCTARASS